MNSTSAPKIIVGMSGGVDSSVAAFLLGEQGHLVEGLFMRNWEEDDGTEYCTAMTDLLDAESVASQLNIPLHTINFSKAYWDRVFTHFLQEYQAGRTPNPDILCNKEIKFRAFLDYALTQGAHCIATGHYVRKKIINGKTYLLKAVDQDKDQSYFLYALSESQVSQALFPLGELKKTAVRQLAAQQGFVNQAKKDSTGICFIGERKFRDFLARYLPSQPGAIETLEGQVIGQHQGLMFYTLGQRQGIGIGGQKNQPEAAWYVISKDLSRNVLIVAQGNNHPALFAQQLTATQINWITEQPNFPLQCSAKIRYRQSDQACTVTSLDVDNLLVEFKQPQRAITPGQSIVFYDQDICLGGGIITNTKAN